MAVRGFALIRPIHYLIVAVEDKDVIDAIDPHQVGADVALGPPFVDNVVEEEKRIIPPSVVGDDLGQAVLGDR